MRTRQLELIIIVLMMAIILLGGIFAYLYFATDVLKTNNQLFFKYLSQFVASEEGFLDNNLSAYFQKKRTGKYEDSGKFYMDINIEGEDTEMLTVLNDFNIEYSGKIDNISRKNEQDICINYSKDVNFPIKYKYTNETLGIQTDYISSKYLGIENKNLKEFAKKFGITDTDTIPDTIDIYEQEENNNLFTFTEQEKEQIINTYKTIIEGKLANKEYKKTVENEVTSYSVEITNKEARELIVLCLEKLKTDTIILPKIEEALKETLEITNQNSTQEITVQDIIQEYIDELNKKEIQEGVSVITVSQVDKKLIGIKLQIDKNEFKITKTIDSGKLTYGIEANIVDSETQDSSKVFLTASYQGLEQLSSVNEEYQYGVIGSTEGKEQKIVYNLNCTDTFKDNISIEDYNDSEIQILNEYDSDQLSNLMVNIGERIIQVNNMQMEEIGFSEYGNPIIYTVPTVALNVIMYNQASKAIEESSLRDTEISLFNSKFIQYEGEQRGTTVKSLLQTIVANNLTEDEKKIEVTGVVTINENDTEAQTGEINSSSMYNIELEYEEGIVSKIIITEQ